MSNNSKNGIRLSNSYIGEYDTYTYGNKRTITTGTSYQTRASTSNTVYQYYDNELFAISTTYFSSGNAFLNGGVDDKSRIFTISTLTHPNPMNFIPGAWQLPRVFFTHTDEYFGPHYALTVNLMYPSIYTTIVNGSRLLVAYVTRYAYEYFVTGTYATHRTITTFISHIHNITNTLYETRASTYNTIYLTKETIDTLTSSQWR